MSADDLSKYSLDLLVSVIGLGAIALVMILAHGRMRFAFSAIIGVFCALLFATAISQTPSLIVYLILFFGGGAGGFVAAFLVVAALHLNQGTKYQEFLTKLRSSLEPLMWLDEGDPSSADVAGVDAQVRRWFVAIAAATGSIVFGLIVSRDFWSAVTAALRPAGLLAAVVSTLVSVVLVGPVHDFVLARSVRDSEGERLPPHKVASTIWQEMSLRSLVRLGLVGIGLMSLEIAYACIGKSMEAQTSGPSSRQLTATFTILLAGLTPGIVSYYWSAALQLGGSQAMFKRAINAATLCTTILFYVFGVYAALILALLFYAFAGHNGTTVAFMLMLSPIIGFFISVAFAILMTWLPAWAGALVLRRMTGWRGMGALYVATAAAALIPVALVAFSLAAFAHVMDWTEFVTSLVGSIGWIVGLIASGFPKLVSQARSPEPLAVTAAPSQLPS